MRMQFLLRRISLLVILCLLVGCGPTKKSFYKPTAKGDAIFKETCGGKASAANGIVFDEDMVNFRFAVAIHRPSLMLEIYFKESGQMAITASKFHIASHGDTHSLHFEKVQVIENSKAPKSYVKDLTLQDTVYLKGEMGTLYYLYFPLAIENKQEFSLTIPHFFINEKNYYFLRFTGL